MRRLKVALVSDFYAPRIGGIERQIEGLATALNARGHEAHVITTMPGPPGHDDDGAVVVHRLPYARLDPPGVALPNFARLPEMRALFRREGYDVVHAHGMFSILALGGIVAASRLGLPTVFTLHSLIRPAVRPIARAVFAIWGRRATLVSAVSRAAAADAVRVTRRADVRVVPNGVSPDWWMGPIEEPPEPRVACVMRLARKKSPLTLVRAMPRVLGAARDNPPTFVIVGDGPERTRVEREAARLGVSHRLELPGALTPAGVAAELRRARVFALPASSESFGLAALEARCAGLPVVAMRRGGLPELVEHGRQGLLADSPDEFASALARLVADDGLRHALRGAARDGVDQFAWDPVVAAHLDLYAEAARDIAPARRARSAA